MLLSSFLQIYYWVCFDNNPQEEEHEGLLLKGWNSGMLINIQALC